MKENSEFNPEFSLSFLKDLRKIEPLSSAIEMLEFSMPQSESLTDCMPREGKWERKSVTRKRALVTGYFLHQTYF